MKMKKNQTVQEYFFIYMHRSPFLSDSRDSFPPLKIANMSVGHSFNHVGSCQCRIHQVFQYGTTRASSVCTVFLQKIQQGGDLELSFISEIVLILHCLNKPI